MKKSVNFEYINSILLLAQKYQVKFEVKLLKG
jgi:hypothetical protein